MVAAALRIELRLPTCHSLKDKRAVIKPIVEGARRRFSVASAEVARQDSWQRAQLGVAAVASAEGRVCEILDRVERFVWSFPEVEVLECSRHFVELDQ